QPENLKQDGSYPPLRVALARGSAAKGAQVVYRQGYYAPRPYRQRGAAERQLAVAEAVMGGGDHGQLRTTVLAAAFRGPAPGTGGGPAAAAAASGESPPGTALPPPGSAGKAYVPVVIETDGASLLNGS